MINSSGCNPITLKAVSETDLPNEENRLHFNMRSGNRSVLPYYQKINKDNEVLLQFYSDSSELPVLKSYINGVEVETFMATLDNHISGVDERYYYSFLVAFDVNYYDKIVSFVLTQSTDTLTSEPVQCYDLSDEIAKGVIKRFDYHNTNRTTGTKDNFFVDWDHFPAGKTMFFYVEGVLLKSNNKDKPETLDGVQSTKIISAKFQAGKVFESGILPKYMINKIQMATSLEYLMINDQLFTKVDQSEPKQLSGCTSFDISVNLLEVNSIGTNVDLLGGLEDMADKEWIKFDNKTGKTSDYSVAVPDGYDFHMITIVHGAGSSINDAAVTCGKTVGGTEYFDTEGGQIIYGYPFVNAPHDRTATTVYIGISGTGVKLDISLQFLRKQPFI